MNSDTKQKMKRQLTDEGETSAYSRVCHRSEKLTDLIRRNEATGHSYGVISENREQRKASYRRKSNGKGVKGELHSRPYEKGKS